MVNPEVKKKAAEGKYALVVPLDYIILGFLPEEGELALGLYPLGETVVNLLKKFTPEQQKHLKTTTITGRLVTMHFQELTVNVPGTSAERRLWQRTKKGTAALNKWKGANGGGSSGSPGGQ